MKVIFHTNIDAYNGKNCFPENLEMPPRIGEFVRVNVEFIDHFQNQKLPARLEVKSVTWMDYAVSCELWYNETDKKLADAAGARTL